MFFCLYLSLQCTHCKVQWHTKCRIFSLVWKLEWFINLNGRNNLTLSCDFGLKKTFEGAGSVEMGVAGGITIIFILDVHFIHRHNCIFSGWQLFIKSFI